MRIRLDQMTTTPSGIRMGVQIAGPKDSWIRFAVLDVPWDSIPKYVMDEYWKWLDRDEIPESLDTPLALDWS